MKFENSVGEPGPSKPFRASTLNEFLLMQIVAQKTIRHNIENKIEQEYLLLMLLLLLLLYTGPKGSAVLAHVLRPYEYWRQTRFETI
jgi:hypothetical protein